MCKMFNSPSNYIAVGILTLSLAAMTSPVSAQLPDIPNDHVLVKHNTRILIKEADGNRVHLVSIVADQILCYSRAYVHVWSFNTIDEMARLLEQQQNSIAGFQPNLDLKNNHHFSVGYGGKFVVEDRTYRWRAGNLNASWIAIDNCDRFEILDFDRMTTEFRPYDEKFSKWRDYAMNNNARLYRSSAVEIMDAPTPKEP
jgi:hypothetical protein